MDFIARKSMWQKSKCKENRSFCDKMISLVLLLVGNTRNILYGYFLLSDSYDPKDLFEKEKMQL